MLKSRKLHFPPKNLDVQTFANVGIQARLLIVSELMSALPAPCLARLHIHR